MRKVLLAFVAFLLLIPLQSFAEEDDIRKKLESLQQEIEALQKQVQELEKEKAAAPVAPEAAAVEEPPAEKTAAVAPWLELGGDFRFRYDYLKGEVPAFTQFGGFDEEGSPIFIPVPKHDVKNSDLLTNRFGLNLKAKATEDVQVKARLLMYKVWGHGTDDPATDMFFADRVGVFDGTVGHVPQDNTLRVDYAYATWSNVFGAPAWFSIGRRPSTGGVPGNIRQNAEKMGTAGIPNILVDYAFDGLSIGYAPYIESLPGAYAKFCYGKGFDPGFESDLDAEDIDDVHFAGLNIVPYDTENLHVEVQWNRGIDIFDSTPDEIGLGPVTTNLGDIDWLGGVVMGRVLGNLNLFASAAISKTHPENFNAMGISLLESCDPITGCAKDSHTGYGVYVGARYDILSTGTKIGAEYNHGSENWISMIPAGDDIWTSKLGTRGNVYEVYVIQELLKKPISKNGKAFFRLGYQYYNFEFTGSNSWLGKPTDIDDLTDDPMTGPLNAQFFTPIESAHDVYLTFDVQF